MGTITRHLLMGNKNGDLKHVWMAAHFPKRIKKELVDETNINSSVDKILEELPVVTYRVLGYYLLGVARIYSKKVEYLFVDCNHSLNEMKIFSEGSKKVDINYGGTCLPESSRKRSQLKVVDSNSSESSRRKISNTFVEAMRAQFAPLSLPENFDLDAYDLEIVEDDSSHDHVRPHLELVLNDAWENHRTVHHTFGKDHASASTSAMITTETSVEKFRHRFILEECLEPMVLSDDDEELVRVSSPIIVQELEWNNNTESSPMMPDGVKNSDKHPDEECTTTGQTVVSEMTSVDNIMLKPSPNKSQPPITINVTPQSKAPVVSGVINPESAHTMSEGVNNQDEHQDEECTTTGQTVVSEMASVDNIMLKHNPNKSHLSVTINVTPQSKAPVSGERKSELVAVRTPASREHAPLTRKRKCVYDYAIVVPNEVYETWVSDASDLIRKRRTWTEVLEQKASRSSDYFMQPQIPINAGYPTEHRFVSSAHEQVVMEEVEETTGLTISKHNELAQLNVQKVSQGTEADVIAPLTPATQSTALRFHDAPETSMVNQMGPTSSCESRERATFPIREAEFDETQREEGPSCLGEVNQEDVLAAEKLSAVTKSVGGYLHRIFVRREKRGEDDAINLSSILKPKTKTESARFFYQMLVLKTGGYIDVKQEKPYDEICVKQTQKLKEAFGGGSRE